MVTFKEISDSISQNKLIGRITASGVIFYGASMLNEYFTNPGVNAEVLAVGSTLLGMASTFLFMSEKD